MPYFVGWCVLAGILSWLFPRLLKQAPFRGLPKDAADFFVRLQEQLTQRHPDIQLVGLTGEGFGAVLRCDRQELALPLGEVFLRERAFPAAFPETIDQLVTEMRHHLAAIDDLPFDEAVQRLLPQIRTEEWVRNNSPAFGPGAIVTNPLFEELVICYVLDEPGSMVFVTEGHLQAWGCRADYIENLATNNLKQLAAEAGGLPLPDPKDSEPTVMSTGDGYDAARVLLALEHDVDRVQGLVFAIPDRDTLVVSRRGDGLARLMGEVGQEFEKSSHPISPQLFEVNGSRLRPVETDSTTS